MLGSFVVELRSLALRALTSPIAERDIQFCWLLYDLQEMPTGISNVIRRVGRGPSCIEDS